MSTVNKVLIFVLLAIALTAGVAIVRPGGSRGAGTRRPPAPEPQAPSQPGVAVHRPEPRRVATAGSPAAAPSPSPSPTPEPSATPSPSPTPRDEWAHLRDGILSADEETRNRALSDLAEMLSRGKGGELLSELLVADKRELRDALLAILPNVAMTARGAYIEHALGAKDPELRLGALSQARELSGVDLNNLLIKAMADTDPAVQDEAADQLILFEDAKDLYRAAAVGLASENETIRQYAFDYMKDTATGQSVVCLTDALKSKYTDVVKKSGDALRLLTGAGIATNGYDEWSKWWSDNRQKWEKDHEPKPQP